ncbi:MAG: SAF domain-containing protein, partial [Anaerolineae bacterium]
MRLRNFLFIIVGLVIIGGIVAAAVFFLNRDNNPPVQPAVDDTTGDTVQAPPEPGVPIPTATPSLRLVNVVVATIDLPVGEEIRSDLVTIEQRPDTNIAIIGQYTYSTTQPLIGQIARVEINKGQAILTDMVTDIPNELGALGSDLALYLEPGQVAVPFPIDKYSGLAYAM